MEVITAREGPSRLNTWLLYHVVGKPRYATVRQCHDMIMACPGATTFQKARGHQLLQLLYVGRAASYRETQRVACVSFMVHFLDRRFCIDAKFAWDMGQYARYMWCCHSLINTSCACKPLQRKSQLQPAKASSHENYLRLHHGHIWSFTWTFYSSKPMSNQSAPNTTYQPRVKVIHPMRVWQCSDLQPSKPIGSFWYIYIYSIYVHFM